MVHINLVKKGFTCKSGGFQNYIGSIELVRYRTYDPKIMPEVNDYLELVSPNTCSIDLGPYTTLNQTDLHQLDYEYQKEQSNKRNNLKTEIQAFYEEQRTFTPTQTTQDT